MPHRYTDVNIKLHQYQGWKRHRRPAGTQRDSFSRKNENKHRQQGRIPGPENRDFSHPHYFFVNLQFSCRLASVWKAFMKQGVDQKGPKLSCGSAAGFRVSLCLIQHVIEAATVENRVSTQHPRCSLPAGKPCLFLPTNSIFCFLFFFFPFRAFCFAYFPETNTHERKADFDETMQT